MWQLINCHVLPKNLPNIATISRGTMKAVVSILLLLLPLATGAGQTVDNQPKRAPIDTLRAEGYEALYNLDYEGARKRFQKMIELAPDHPAGAQCLASSFGYSN